MKIGLALSGGGVRAAAFHLGLLLRLAKSDLLENMARLSTVSGGTLVTALIFSHNGLKWPESEIYERGVYPDLRRILTTVDLLTFWSLFKNPAQLVQLLPGRSRILVNRLKSRWNVSGSLSDLPDTPSWTINTTCVETGKNWRFSKSEMGDWVFGRRCKPDFEIAEAAAASAAVPYVIGAVKFNLPQRGWYETDPATGKALHEKDAPFQSVRLWDGGAYENLGLESLYKPDRAGIGCDEIIVSDASGILPPAGGKGVLRNLLGGNLPAPRLFEITSDQIRALRSRMFIAAVKNREVNGSLVKMGNTVRNIDKKSKFARSESEYAEFQPDEEVKRASMYPTNLGRLSAENFDLIARHGYEAADATIRAYRPEILAAHVSWDA